MISCIEDGEEIDTLQSTTPINMPNSVARRVSPIIWRIKLSQRAELLDYYGEEHSLLEGKSYVADMHENRKQAAKTSTSS